MKIRHLSIEQLSFTSSQLVVIYHSKMWSDVCLMVQKNIQKVPNSGSLDHHTQQSINADQNLNFMIYYDLKIKNP